MVPLDERAGHCRAAESVVHEDRPRQRGNRHLRGKAEELAGGWIQAGAAVRRAQHDARRRLLEQAEKGRSLELHAPHGTLVSMLNPHIFRAYDVRGRVGGDVNPEVFEQIGRAYASLIQRKGGRVVAVGQDNRESSADLRTAFVTGVRVAGVDVVDIGLVTTPLLYFATAHWKLDGGANITGSHNPIEYNGVKMVHRGAAPLHEDEIQSLRTMVETRDWDSGRGGLQARSPREDYFSTVQRLVRLPRRLTIVADAGNGIAGVYGP